MRHTKLSEKEISTGLLTVLILSGNLGDVAMRVEGYMTEFSTTAFDTHVEARRQMLGGDYLFVVVRLTEPKELSGCCFECDAPIETDNTCQCHKEAA